MLKILTIINIVVVSSCLAGLQQVLDNDIAAKLVLKYYQLTNRMANSQCDPDDEWQNFCEAMWKLLGYRGAEEVGLRWLLEVPLSYVSFRSK